MNIIISLFIAVGLSYLFSNQIKKYNKYIYIWVATLSMMAIIHAILILNSYSIHYVSVLKWLMKAIDSGAMGGAFFILVMYMGVFDMRMIYARKLRTIRAELSIIACIITIPHNIHYLFAFILNMKNIVSGRDISLWLNLMMFASGIFAIGIMIPLFITSFTLIRKKMNGKAWKNLQEFAYIFYAMIFVQIIMVYLSKPSSLARNLNLIFYILLFSTYTVLKLKIILEKRRNRALVQSR
ncbi:ferric reductase-like transmembrane domain-containing protein [Peptostreptococcus equinus]|uniref:Ferric reductase-like transmembrane domain-containing protein n=1 Tax=Peptostreptococcus equinus TaxID=3003601 RepID=A0ABY7JNR3_9FIRM|nr:ferric reductase-like transmembrane domain-containing protein [Peptostreptococcus sp. CBA3647]WAW15011.1 ferric reductase-like transmembrane domain-containing protein [Peptostreptococcus sp. CBA3647]